MSHRWFGPFIDPLHILIIDTPAKLTTDKLQQYTTPAVRTRGFGAIKACAIGTIHDRSCPMIGESFERQSKVIYIRVHTSNPAMLIVPAPAAAA